MKNLLITYSLIFIINSSCLGQWIEYNSFTSESLYDIYFTNQQTGWTNGGWYNSKLFKTSDYGESWEQILEQGYIGNVYSPEMNKVFISVEGGLSYSSDGGISWNFTNFNYSGINIRDIDFIDPNHGWVCDHYKLFYTNDGGVNWNEGEPFPYPGLFWADLISVSFVDTSQGWVLRDNGDVHNSTNGGLSWPIRGTVEGGIYLNNNGIYFADSIYGYVIAFNGVWKTTDGGTNWLLLENSQDKEIFCFYFINKDIGWIGGQKGIFRTKNGGEDWLFQYYGKNVQSLHFLDENIGWASGNDGLLLYTSNGGGDSVFVSVKNESNHINILRLEQNYPNPFNPETRIKFSLPNSNEVIIKVYDMLGEELKTLINEYKQAGTYEVEFNASNLPSGIYFYRMIRGSYSETKKMILLR